VSPIVTYGGTKEEVEKQLVCEHHWHGPCIDWISRFNKCKICYAVERDMTEEQFKEHRLNNFTRLERARKLIEGITGLRPVDTAAIEEALNIIDGIDD
jgi:hypothetical protein